MACVPRRASCRDAAAGPGLRGLALCLAAGVRSVAVGLRLRGLALCLGVGLLGLAHCLDLGVRGLALRRLASRLRGLALCLGAGARSVAVGFRLRGLALCLGGMAVGLGLRSFGGGLLGGFAGGLGRRGPGGSPPGQVDHVGPGLDGVPVARRRSGGLVLRPGHHLDPLGDQSAGSPRSSHICLGIGCTRTRSGRAPQQDVQLRHKPVRDRLVGPRQQHLPPGQPRGRDPPSARRRGTHHRHHLQLVGANRLRLSRPAC